MEFKATLVADNPGHEWELGLQSLWWDAKGDWQKAHDLVDGSDTEYADWIHAYLHRKEGDQWNASYWYRRANRPFPKVDLEEEQKELVTLLLIT